MRKAAQRASASKSHKCPIDEVSDAVDIHHHQSWRHGSSHPVVSHTTSSRSSEVTSSAALAPGLDVPMIQYSQFTSDIHEMPDDVDELYLDPALQEAGEQIFAEAPSVKLFPFLVVFLLTWHS